MPGIPLVARETMYGQSRSGDQSCRQDSRLHLSAEEEIDAEESLSVYCKPVELYNILQRRSVRNPLFLQRCLHYKVRSQRHKRIFMSISLSETLADGLQVSSLFPVHIILARRLSGVPNLEHTAVYRYTKVRTLTNPSREEGGNVARANFILPEMNKLAREAKSGSLFILFVSYARLYASNGFDPSREHLNNLCFPSTIEKPCLWGKISMESLFLSWEKFPNLNKGDRAEMLSTVDLHPCVLKCGFAGKVNCISFHIPENSSDMSTLPQVQVTISAEEQGAKEKSPYSPCTYNNTPASSSHVVRLRTGNVIFNYKYYHNKLQRTEVTEDFSCPFCLVKCASFKGLKLHLPAFHDLFIFEFWVYASEADRKQQIFFFCYKPLRRRKSKGLIDAAKHIHPLTLTSDFAAASDLLNRADDDFVDVSKEEKQMMHLWISFIRKQRYASYDHPVSTCRVLADGHIPYACEAFSRLHGRNLVQVPALIWCWRLFMIKLWNQGLLDARTMNNCNFILDENQKQVL